MAKRPEEEKVETEREIRQKNNWYSKNLLLIAVGLAVAVLLVFSLSSNKSSVSINDAELSDIATYLSQSSADPDKTKQSSFERNDSIQVGVSYIYENEDVAEETVKFVVVNEQAEEVFATNLFNLKSSESQLFVSINNTSLPPSEYTVQVRDTQDSIISKAKFKINE